MSDTILDPSRVIFDLIFPISVGYNHIVRDEHSLGFSLTGDEDLDKSLYTAKTEVMWCIADITDHWYDGKDFAIFSKDVAILIYDHIVSYLDYWLDALDKGSLNKVSAPFEDLYKLDGLAQYIHSSFRLELVGREGSTMSVGSVGAGEVLSKLFAGEHMERAANTKYSNRTKELMLIQRNSMGFRASYGDPEGVGLPEFTEEHAAIIFKPMHDKGTVEYD